MGPKSKVNDRSACARQEARGLFVGGSSVAIETGRRERERAKERERGGRERSFIDNERERERDVLLTINK